jgi:hypothetical protein
VVGPPDGHGRCPSRGIHRDIAHLLPRRAAKGPPRSRGDGRPIIATDMPGCREIVRHGYNGLLVPTRDPIALADALGTLLGDPEMRTRMGKAGRSMVVNDFSEEQVIDETMQVYLDVLGVNGDTRTRAGLDAYRRRDVSEPRV